MAAVEAGVIGGSLVGSLPPFIDSDTTGSGGSSGAGRIYRSGQVISPHRSLCSFPSLSMPATPWRGPPRATSR